MKRSNRYRWSMLPLLLTVAVLLVLGSACEPAPVSISPTSQTVSTGETFTVDILVEPTVIIAGAQFDLSFDSSLVTAISVAEGDLFNQGGCSTFFLPGTIDNDAGTITGVVCVIITPGCAVLDPGILATITFVAGETEGTSPLELCNFIVGNKEGTAVFREITDGSVTVSAP